MTIHPRPDQEQTIQQAIQAGLIASAEEALDVGIPTLRERLERNTGGGGPATVEPLTPSERKKNLVELFEDSPWKGLDLDFSRNKSTGRPLDL